MTSTVNAVTEGEEHGPLRSLATSALVAAGALAVLGWFVAENGPAKANPSAARYETGAAPAPRSPGHPPPSHPAIYIVVSQEQSVLVGAELEDAHRILVDKNMAVPEDRILILNEDDAANVATAVAFHNELSAAPGIPEIQILDLRER